MRNEDVDVLKETPNAALLIGWCAALDLSHVEKSLKVKAGERVAVEEERVFKGCRKHCKDTEDTTLDATGYASSKASYPGRPGRSDFTERLPAPCHSQWNCHGGRAGHIKRLKVD